MTWGHNCPTLVPSLPSLSIELLEGFEGVLDLGEGGLNFVQVRGFGFFSLGGI